MVKCHDRKYFYKYVSARIAKLILDELQIKCSSPLLFNDLFDSQIASPPDIEDDRVLTEKILDIGFNNYDLSSEFDSEQLRDFMSEDTSSILESRAAIERFYEQLNQIAADFRVFCVSEAKDNLLMWAHYADEHRGAVIKFRCAVEKSTGLCGAKRVNYSEQGPVLPLEEILVPSLRGKMKMADKAMELFLTKDLAWAYEKEWRMILKPQGQGDSDLRGIWKEELEAIYLGCRMPCDDKKELLDIIKAELKHMRVFQSEKDQKGFELSFRELSY